jgi:hypothetical protein
MEWCKNGQANSCPPHSNSSALSSSLDQCLCNPGYFGDASISATLCQFCKDDHFCPGRGANLSYVCPNGKYSLPGSDDEGDCNCPTNAVSQQKASQVMQCVCSPGYYRVYNYTALLGGWQCALCKPGEYCYDNLNATCPPHSVSLAVAGALLDCFCTPGYKNASAQTALELCVECPANSYCTGKGAVSACVTHAISPTQSRDASKCYCDQGWKGLNNSACVACDTPTFCYEGIEAKCSEGTFSQAKSWTMDNCSCIAGRWGPKGEPLTFLIPKRSRRTGSRS